MRVLSSTCCFSVCFFACLELAHAQVDSSVTIPWFNVAKYNRVSLGILNPENSKQKVPSWLFLTEVRPDIKLSYNNTKAIVRPRAYVEWARVKVRNTFERPKRNEDFAWSEAYVQWNASDAVTLAYGIQNYQWGPAESASPSNPLVHETAQGKDILFEVRGLHQARLNLTFGSDFSFVTLLELPGQDKEDFVAGEPFQVSVVQKNEYSWNSGANYFGITFGGNKTQRWLGEYLNVEVSEGTTTYLDVRHEKGSLAWYPAEKDGIVSLQQTEKGSARLFTYAVLGARYTFEGGSDFRLEGIFNEGGYTLAQRQFIKKAFVSANVRQLATLPEILSKSQHLGVEFPGRKFVLISFRVPDFFSVKDLTILLRNLKSLTDDSALFYASAEYPVTESAITFAGTSYTHAKEDEELFNFARHSALLGVKYVW